MSVTFIGGGNMAGALIGGLIQKGWSPAAVSVVELLAEARRALQQRYRVAVQAELPECLPDDEIVVFAVKPQQLPEAARALRTKLHNQLVVTIAAGIRTTDLSRWLGAHSRIIRVMPNTPALVLSGVSALYAMPGVSGVDRQETEAILSAVGATLWVEREELMDAVTAVSGSGPAYLFYFMEAVMQAARELGLTADEARTLTLETFYGAACLARQSEESPAVLRARVTSKGGTTERALRVLGEHGVRDSIVDAVNQAAARSRELGDELGQSS